MPLSSHPLMMKNPYQIDLVRFSLTKLKRSEISSNTAHLSLFILTRSCQFSVPVKVLLRVKSSSSRSPQEAPSKTCSLDPCPTYIVKKCIDILLPSLAKLVNLSLQNGIFQAIAKQAIVTPLIKKSTFSKENLKSYRPVSGLSERIVATQIRSHMDSHDLGNTFQSAYKVRSQTETAYCVSKMRFIYLCPRACLQ